MWRLRSCGDKCDDEVRVSCSSVASVGTSGRGCVGGGEPYEDRSSLVEEVVRIEDGGAGRVKERERFELLG